MSSLVLRLSEAYRDLKFVAGTSFYWCPETSEVFYDAERIQAAAPAEAGAGAGGQSDHSGLWSLLHETSHAILRHTTYQTDVELLHLEVAAWSQAVVLAPKYGISIDEDYIQDCLDTYRDWLYRRSLCPGCGTQCLQTDESSHYRCFNCHTRWHVSPSRFCRAYRRAQAKKPAGSSALVFASTIR